MATANDTLVEGPEDYTLTITAVTPDASSTGAAVAVSGSEYTVTTTITDNDTATWSLTQSSTTVAEGATASYTLALAGTLRINTDKHTGRGHHVSLVGPDFKLLGKVGAAGDFQNTGNNSTLSSAAIVSIKADSLNAGFGPQAHVCTTISSLLSIKGNRGRSSAVTE